MIRKIILPFFFVLLPALGLQADDRYSMDFKAGYNTSNLSYSSFDSSFNSDGDFGNIKIKRFENFENTDFMNVIFALAKNSLEAGSSRFDVNITKTNSSYIILFMDDGNGIRDSRGIPIRHRDYNNIFTLHYSSKDKYGKNKKQTLFTYISNIILEQKSTRGVGLWLNKKLLSYANIILDLESTSNEGTTFKIVIPKGATYV